MPSPERPQDLSLSEVREGLHVTVDQAFAGIESSLVTQVEVKPPVTNDEFDDLVILAKDDEYLDKLLAGSSERVGAWTRFVVDGTPNEQNVGVAKRLTDAMLTVRGLRAAYFGAAVDGKATFTVILNKDTGEHV